MGNETIIQLLKNSIMHVDANAKIILYGSRARGDNKKDSDWDLLLLTSLPENEATKKQFRRQIYQIELVTDETISSIIHNKNRWEQLQVTSLYKNILQEGKEL